MSEKDNMSCWLENGSTDPVTEVDMPGPVMAHEIIKRLTGSWWLMPHGLRKLLRTPMAWLGWVDVTVAQRQLTRSIIENIRLENEVSALKHDTARLRGHVPDEWMHRLDDALTTAKSGEVYLPTQRRTKPRTQSPWDELERAHPYPGME